MGFDSSNGQQPSHIPGFDNNTRLRTKVQPSITRPTGGGLTSFSLSKVGLLKGIHLGITGAITSGGLSALNAAGKSSIVKRVRCSVNNGNMVFSVSGVQFHWILRDFIDGYYNPFPGGDGRSAVATGNYRIDMYIPIMINERDPIGLFLLQNEQTVVTVEIEWESDVTVATGITTLTGTAVPTLEFFQVPQYQADWPDIFTFHSIIGDENVVAQASGDYSYAWPKGNVYLQMLHGYGIGVSGTDSADKIILRANQTDTLYEHTPSYQDFLFADNHPTTRPAGVYALDLMGSSGIGAFGSARDQIDSASAADLYSILTVNAAKTLHSVRRMLIPAQY